MVEIAGITVFLGLILLLSVRILLAVKDWNDALWVGICVVAGFLLADFVSGLVHWAGDTLATVEAPFLGPHFIKPFREHHTDPRGITRHDFVETNGNNCLISVPLLSGITPVMPEETGPWFYCCSTIVFLTWFVFGTNQFHKWAHAETPPRFALVLQRWGVILPPAHHDIHHTAPHDTHYCITVGWLNPILAQLRFFRVLEWMVARTWPALLQIEDRQRLRALMAAAAADRVAAVTPAAGAGIPRAPRS
jgi:ubiquitin-conjugating enzyme E2 variant